MRREAAVLVLVSALCMASFLATPVSGASEYEMGIEEEDRVVYELVSWDEDLAKKYLGSGDPEDELGEGAELHFLMAYEVDDVDEREDLWSWDDMEYTRGWRVYCGVWTWTDEESDLEEDPNLDEEIDVYEDPNDCGEEYGLVFESVFLPKVVSKYLEEVEWSDEYEHEDMKVTREYESDAGKDIREVRAWKDNGVLRAVQVYTDEDELIYEVAIRWSLPDYFWIVVVCAAVASAVIICAVLYLSRRKGAKKGDLFSLSFLGAEDRKKR